MMRTQSHELGLVTVEQRAVSNLAAAAHWQTNVHN
jgi:hypothetical protein